MACVASSDSSGLEVGLHFPLEVRSDARLDKDKNTAASLLCICSISTKVFAFYLSKRYPTCESIILAFWYLSL
jgi:hypothetical protein